MTHETAQTREARPMTELEELKKLLAEAEKQSPLPWYTNGTSLFDDATYKLCDYLDPPEAALIVAAVNALPGLIARVEEMEAALQEIARCERYLSEADTSYEYEMRQIELCRLIKTRAALRKEP